MIGTHGMIEGDLYDISSRVKEIDPAYFIVRNYKTGKFELHAGGSLRGGTLALVLPYSRLDERALTLARKTRAGRARALIEEIEKSNEKLERERVKKITEKALEGGGF